MDGLNCAASSTGDKLPVFVRVADSVPRISQRFKHIAFPLPHQDAGKRSLENPARSFRHIIAKRYRIAIERQMRTRLQNLLQTLGTHDCYAWSHSKTERLRGRDLEGTLESHFESIE